jgi:phosphinothricin acetyltransferase
MPDVSALPISHARPPTPRIAAIQHHAGTASPLRRGARRGRIAAAWPTWPALSPWPAGGRGRQLCRLPYRARSGYRFSVENSIYLAPAMVGRGIGSRLLADLIVRCEAGPWRQMVAVIGDSANHASIRLHARMGFRSAGVLQAVGFKFGRWVDSVLMQRPLAGSGPG